MKIDKSCPKFVQSEVWRQNTIGFESCPKVQSLTTRKGWTKGECENQTKLRFQCLLSSCLWAEKQRVRPLEKRMLATPGQMWYLSKNYPDNFWKRTLPHTHPPISLLDWLKKQNKNNGEGKDSPHKVHPLTRRNKSAGVRTGGVWGVRKYALYSQI